MNWMCAKQMFVKQKKKAKKKGWGFFLLFNLFNNLFVHFIYLYYNNAFVIILYNNKIIKIIT